MNINITKEEINELPLVSFKGDIRLVTNELQMQEAYKYLREFRALGFDTESRPAFKKGEHYDISLLQLSTDDVAYIFQLKKVDLDYNMISLLEDKKIVKVGVAIKDDIEGLQKLYPIKDGGFVELATLAKAKGIKRLGLRSLVAILFNQRVSKKVRTSNWEQPKLSPAQKNYAACDAWLSLRLYEALK